MRGKCSQCPLIIWSAVCPPQCEIAEVVALDRPREDPVLWLSPFLSQLRRGIDPEAAFARAGLHAPLEDRRARWLRGAFRSWHVTPVDPGQPIGVPLPEGWHVRMAGARQSAALTDLVHDLAQPLLPRRVQVVLTPGPARAGLERFRRRALSISHDVPSLLVEDIDLGWTDDPGNQVVALLRSFGASSVSGLPHSVVERAQQRSPMGRVLFCLRHETLTLNSQEAKEHGLPLTTPDGLRRYLGALKLLAEALQGHEARLLVHLSVQGATSAELSALKVSGAALRVDVLETLDNRVPEGELREWLDRHSLACTEEDLAALAQLSYEDLVESLVQRFSIVQ